MKTCWTSRGGVGERLPAAVLLAFVAVLVCARHPIAPARAAEEATAGLSPASGPTGAPLVLSLDGAVTLAVANDEQLRQARDAIAAAEADLLGARSGVLPRLDLAATYTANLKKASFFLPPDMASAFGGVTRIETGRDYNLLGAASLTWTLWSAGRLSAGIGAAGEALAATRWQEELVADVVHYSVRVAYHGVQLAGEQVAIAEKALSETEEALRIARAGLDEGTTSRFDALRAEVELANRKAPLTQARNALDQARLRLLRACGLPADAAVVLTDSLAETADTRPVDDLLARMRETSPELKALSSVVALNRQSVSLARAGRGPVVQLQGSYVLQGEWDEDLLPGADERATSGSVALAVSLPVFDGFETKAGIQRAEANLRTAQVELERVTRDRELSVRQAGLTLQSARAALVGRRESVALAEEAYRLALVRLENGLATPLERLDAELALTEARAQLASTLYEVNIAGAALDLAVGSDCTTAAVAEEVAR